MDGTPHISKIELNNGELISLDLGGILALVGPNNAGKTYFLKSVRSHLHAEEVEEVSPDSGAIKSLQLSWKGSSETIIRTLRERTRQSFRKTGDRFVPDNKIRYSSGGVIGEDSYEQQVNNNSYLGAFTDLFLEFDDALGRIQETELQKQINPNVNNKPSLTQLARENPSEDKKIKHYFRRIFHKELSYYDQGYGQVGFLLAPELQGGPGLGSAIDKRTQDYMKTSQKIWLQGLGMRSVLGLLLRIFAGGKEIIIIDEPEAFLHPPQASALGDVLAEIAADGGKQIILATHDRNILNGLTKSPRRNVAIQRINRQDNKTTIRSISATTLDDVRDRSLIRYSPLLDSLFSQVTILVENEKDAFFYSESINFLIESNGGDYQNFTVDDILFVSTSGKGGLARTAELITSLHSTAIIACDFDLLVNPQQFEDVLKGVCKDPDKIEGIKKNYFSLMSLVFDEADMKQQDREKQFKPFKNSGIRSEFLDFNENSKELLSDLDALGICLNHLGELEDFKSELTSRKTKTEWVNRALHDNVHQGEEAQLFAKRVLSSVFGAHLHAL